MPVIAMEKKGDAVFLTLTGEVTMVQVPIPRDEVAAVFALAPFSLVRADLSAVTFMDSTGVNFLAMLNNRLREAGCRFEIHNASESARRILDLTQLSTLLHMVESGPEG